MTPIIRNERAGDADAIARLLRQAFENHAHSQQTEHLIVERLRTAGQLVLPKVAFVDREIVGYATFSPVRLEPQHDGWYGLGPVAVAPDLQRNGIGSALIRAGLDELARGGAAGCVVLGEPAYYTRFGFVHAPGLVLEGVPPGYFMARAFRGAIPAAVVSYSPHFYVSADD